MPIALYTNATIIFPVACKRGRRPLVLGIYSSLVLYKNYPPKRLGHFGQNLEGHGHGGKVYQHPL